MKSDNIKKIIETNKNYIIIIILILLIKSYTYVTENITNNDNFKKIIISMCVIFINWIPIFFLMIIPCTICYNVYRELQKEAKK